jgi:hypothetical protein
MVWGASRETAGAFGSPLGARRAEPGLNRAREGAATGRGDEAHHRVCEGHTLEGHKAMRGSVCERG